MSGGPLCWSPEPGRACAFRHQADQGGSQETSHPQDGVGPPATLNFKPKGSKPGSRVLGGRLTSLWRTSLPPEGGLGKAGGEGIPAQGGLSAPGSAWPGPASRLGACWSEARAEASLGCAGDGGRGSDASRSRILPGCPPVSVGGRGDGGGAADVGLQCGGPCSPDVDLPGPRLPRTAGWVLGTAPVL